MDMGKKYKHYNYASILKINCRVCVSLMRVPMKTPQGNVIVYTLRKLLLRKPYTLHVEVFDVKLSKVRQHSWNTHYGSVLV